jgi:hypothetical protein
LLLLLISMSDNWLLVVIDQALEETSILSRAADRVAGAGIWQVPSTTNVTTVSRPGKQTDDTCLDQH